MISTKEQEQKALDKIKAILETLEPGSYVRTAFDGCVDAAQSNIANDYIESPYDDCLKAEKRAEEAEEEVKALKAENDKLRACSLSFDELDACDDAILGAERLWAEERKTSEDFILENAENPTSNKFTNAVNHRRVALRKLARLAATKSRVREVKANLNA